MYSLKILSSRIHEHNLSIGILNQFELVSREVRKQGRFEEGEEEDIDDVEEETKVVQWKRNMFKISITLIKYFYCRFNFKFSVK